MGIVDKAKAIMHMDRSNELNTSTPGPHVNDFSVTDPNRLPGALGQVTDTDIGGKINNILGPQAVMQYAAAHGGVNATDTSTHSDVHAPVQDIAHTVPGVATGAPLHVLQVGPQDIPITGMTTGIPYTTDQPAVAGAIGTHGYVGAPAHVTPVPVALPGQPHAAVPVAIVPTVIAPAMTGHTVGTTATGSGLTDNVSTTATTGSGLTGQDSGLPGAYGQTTGDGIGGKIANLGVDTHTHRQ